VRRVLIVSGAGSVLLLLVVVVFVAWRFSGIYRLNRQIRAERAFLQTMIDAIPDPIFFKNRNRLYLGCNACFSSQCIGLPKVYMALGSLEAVHPPPRAFTRSMVALRRRPRMLIQVISLLSAIVDTVMTSRALAIPAL
jgi:hypothetical protein